MNIVQTLGFPGKPHPIRILGTAPTATNLLLDSQFKTEPVLLQDPGQEAHVLLGVDTWKKAAYSKKRTKNKKGWVTPEIPMFGTPVGAAACHWMLQPKRFSHPKQRGFDPTKSKFNSIWPKGDV